METPKVLALDFGTVRIGCAVSYGTLAEPLCIIGNTDKMYSEISELIQTYGIQLILVGMSERASAERAYLFGETVKKMTGIPVSYADETLSTQSARRKLREQNKVVPVVDHFAAAEFLQEWLDGHDS